MLGGLDLGMLMLDILLEMPTERVEPKDVYGILIRSKDDKLHLKSGYDFSQWTIQKTFEAVARAVVAYPHVKVKDSRGKRRVWKIEH
jgi:hypothetical protein